MRPTEERSPHGYGDGDDRPDPLVAQNAPEFVTQLRTLVQWSGLTLEEIEQLARANGDILPPSIVSAALSHHTLPPEEVVVALVAAIGDDDDMVELWASVLWRLEDMEAAATTAPVSTAPGPHHPPMSAPPLANASSAPGSHQYSGGSLAQAVQSRRNQSSWTGLHRGFQKGLRATGLGARFGSWPAPVAIGAAIMVVIGGVTWAVASGGGGENDPEPRANPCCVEGSREPMPSAEPLEEISPSGMTMVLPVPGGSTKASPTPRQTTQPSRSSPTPTWTQTQQSARLSGDSDLSSCQDSSGQWMVTLSVTAVLTGASTGNNPQGQGGKSGDLKPINFSPESGTSFSGSVQINVGPSTALATGSLSWSVTVTVPGADPVNASGTQEYNCGS